MLDCIFNKGKITSLKNIPPNVKEIQISDNLLIEIEELPKNLEILNVENNYLSKFHIYCLLRHTCVGTYG